MRSVLVRVPGDKSVSHRALVLHAMARGTGRVTGLGTGGDVASTRRCLEALGMRMEHDGAAVVLHGAQGRLMEPAEVLDCGNSGTTLRLLAGLLAGQEGHLAVLTGDASLRGRPVGRVVAPLRRLGGTLQARAGDRLPPLVVRGARLVGADVEGSVASAQVKSAVLLAGLQAEGVTTYTEPAPSRDHTERMLTAMGVRLEVEGTRVRLRGGQVPQALELVVPGDPSSAAFWAVAAAITPGLEVRLPGVLVNPGRTGALEVLQAMGAEVGVERGVDRAGEPVADVVVRRVAGLRGVRVEGSLVVRCLDELPVLAVAAVFAEGETVVADAAELRVKESDRVASTVAGLRAIGVEAEERADGFVVRGRAGEAPSGGVVQVHGDHRIAMAFAVAGLRCPVSLAGEGGAAASVSYPGFLQDLARVRAAAEGL